MKKWFLYVVECSDRSLYTGATTDLDRRVYQHNFTSRGAKYTRARRPVRLVYWQQYENRSGALKAEALFKKKTRTQKMEKIFWGEPTKSLSDEQLDMVRGGMSSGTFSVWRADVLNGDDSVGN